MVVALVLSLALALLPSQSHADDDICAAGFGSLASPLDGGPTMLAAANATECRALCEDHEFCGGYVMKSRKHPGCLKVNAYSFSNGKAHHSNLPPLWPAAQCQMLAPLAAGARTKLDNCSCFGTPRPACPVHSSTPQPCFKACPVAQLTGSSGVRCGRRRGFTVGDPLASPSAIHCEGACGMRDDCVAWSWTSCSSDLPGTCRLKNLVGRIEDEVEQGGETFSCTATKKFEAPDRDVARHRRSDGAIVANNFTTWGYLSNHYHRVRHMSGMWRADDQLNGMSIYPAREALKDPDVEQEAATLFVAAPSDSRGSMYLLTAEDYDRAGVERTSPIHTKARLMIAHGTLETTYYQVTENVLAAHVKAAASPHTPHLILRLDAGGKSSHAGYTTATLDSSTVLCSGGPKPGVWGITTDAEVVSGGFYSSLTEVRAALARGLPPAGLPQANFSTNSSTLYVTLGFNSASGPMNLTVYTARAAPESCVGGVSRGCTSQPKAVYEQLQFAKLGEAQNQLNRHTVEDNKFWKGALKLEGSWPEHFKRGIQYDLNSVRANIRPAHGVFKHPWGDMQVHGGRIVVAETSMTTMTLSYADMALAKEVLYGLYADTAARGQPNVPCQNEDGTPNMECMDNKTAGTPPSWGTPLFTIHSIFQRDGDSQWLAKMYPLLSGYLNFWLKNRTDSGGYQIAMCSWESGQDNGRRWGWADPSNKRSVPGPIGGAGIIGGQVYGGDRSSRTIRAPEHQAAMAYSAGVMAAFARHLKKPASEISKWMKVVETHVKLTDSLFHKSTANDTVGSGPWWCDYNSVANVWQTGCNDAGPPAGTTGAGKQVMQLAPLFFHAPALGVDLLSSAGIDKATLTELLDALSNPHKFGSCEGKPIPSASYASYCWREKYPRCSDATWGPQPFYTISIAGNVNATAMASSTTTRLVDEVWSKTDARSRTHIGGGGGSPYPGVSYECWNLNYSWSDKHGNITVVPAMQEGCGAEDYSWTTEATTVAFIREVIGFREHHSFGQGTFILRPALPKEWVDSAAADDVYIVRDLHWRGMSFDLHLTPSGEAGFLDVIMQGVGDIDTRHASFRLRNAEEEVHVRVLEHEFAIERQTTSFVSGAAMKHDDEMDARVSAPSKPNVLFIVADDMRPALPTYGHPEVHAPTLAALAARGLQFNKAYCAIAVCSPSRNSLLSGRRPDVTKAYNFIDAFRGTPGSPGDKWTSLPQAFKNAGYLTYGTGKVFHDGPPLPPNFDPRSWTQDAVQNSDGGYNDGVMGGWCARDQATPGVARHGTLLEAKANPIVREFEGKYDPGSCFMSCVHNDACKSFDFVPGNKDKARGNCGSSIPNDSKSRCFLYADNPAPQVDNNTCWYSGRPAGPPIPWGCSIPGASMDGEGAFHCQLVDGRNSSCVGASFQDRHVADDAVMKLRHAISVSEKHLAATGSRKSFFLAVGFHKPHAPWRVPKILFDTYYSNYSTVAADKLPPSGFVNISWHRPNMGEQFMNPDPFHPMPDAFAAPLRAHYLAAITWTDRMAGRVLAALNTSGEEERTIVAFTGDHGWSLGEQGEWRKFTNWENGVRVPMFLAVPWVPKSFGKSTPHIVEHLDLFPSLLSLCGLKLPEPEIKEAPLAGQDLSPLLVDQTIELDKNFALSQFPRCANKVKESNEAFPWSGECLTGATSTRSRIPYMGYTLRTQGYRYTEWPAWDGARLAPDWTNLTIGNQVGQELYDHRLDTGVSASSFSTFETANLAQSADPALLRNLSSMLHQLVAAQRK